MFLNYFFLLNYFLFFLVKLFSFINMCKHNQLAHKKYRLTRPGPFLQFGPMTRRPMLYLSVARFGYGGIH